MGDLKKRRATYDDLLQLPDNVVGEIVDGELIATPRPRVRHARTAIILGGDLTGPFDKGSGGPGGWWFLGEPELHFGQDVLVPDLAGWRRERLPKLPDAAAIEVAPDWVCEVVSPSTAKYDRGPKMAAYARVGIPHLWLIDPAARTLEVYVLRDAHWMLMVTHIDDAKVRAIPFDAVEIEIGRWWLEP